MNPNNQIKNRPQKIKVLKEYTSKMDGKNIICLRLCARGNHFGVVKIYPDSAVAYDYSNNEKLELRTFVGNEESIIDWVDIDLANRRYASLVTEFMYQGIKLPNTPRNNHLVLVQVEKYES